LWRCCGVILAAGRAITRENGCWGVGFGSAPFLLGSSLGDFGQAPVCWNHQDLSDVLKSSASVPKSVGPSRLSPPSALGRAFLYRRAMNALPAAVRSEAARSRHPIRIRFCCTPFLVALFAQPVVNSWMGALAGPMAVCCRLALTFFFLCHCSKLQSGAASRFDIIPNLVMPAAAQQASSSRLRSSVRRILPLAFRGKSDTNTNLRGLLSETSRLRQ
jgi:hypothetical protein